MNADFQAIVKNIDDTKAEIKKQKNLLDTYKKDLHKYFFKSISKFSQLKNKPYKVEDVVEGVSIYYWNVIHYTKNPDRKRSDFAIILHKNGKIELSGHGAKCEPLDFLKIMESGESKSPEFFTISRIAAQDLCDILY